MWVLFWNLWQQHKYIPLLSELSCHSEGEFAQAKVSAHIVKATVPQDNVHLSKDNSTF